MVVPARFNSFVQELVSVDSSEMLTPTLVDTWLSKARAEKDPRVATEYVLLHIRMLLRMSGDQLRPELAGLLVSMNKQFDHVLEMDGEVVTVPGLSDRNRSNIQRTFTFAQEFF